MKRDLNRLSSEEYDIVVVGGGIYGASLIWDATVRGLKVALIDKGDFCGATSFNTLKIVHGGLRYLQQLDFKRMRESIYERMVLMRIAPHLIYPLPFVMPTYGYKFKSRSALFAALLINDLISYGNNKLNDPSKHLPKGRIISKDEVKEYIMGYEGNKVTGGALWYDCQCYNTERLVLSYLLSAAEAGAEVANYVTCKGFLGNENGVTGLMVQDSLTGDTFDIKARTVVNTSGPWVDAILSNLKGRVLKRRFVHSSGMNIIVNRKMLNGYAAGLPAPYRFEGKNGSIYKGYRMLFVCPWKDYTLIGTNHLPYFGNPEEYVVSEKEIQEFVKDVNQAYPAANIKREEISFFHGGLLPMRGTKPETGEVQLLGKYRIYDHLVEEKVDGLITVVGAKYTTHRDVARKTVDLLFKKLKLGKSSPQCTTEARPIYGGAIEHFNDFLSDAIKRSGLNEKVTRHLAYSYGSKYKDILKYGDQNTDLIQTVDGSDKVLKAEIINSIRNEMALKLCDVILRRTGLGSGENPGEKALRAVADIMAQELRWDIERTEREIQETRLIYIPAGGDPRE